MAISPLASPSTPSATPQAGTNSSASPTLRATEDSSQLQQMSATELRNQRTKEHNLSILQANQNASLSATSEPLSLLYQTAIDAINAELAPTLGENAVQRTQQEGIDTSAEATAERIVSASVSSFGRFQELHADLPEAEQLDRFLDVISSGIEEGFAAAKDILEGLSVLEGSIAEDIDKTYDLVQQGLEQFRELFSADKASGADAADDPSVEV